MTCDHCARRLLWFCAVVLIRTAAQDNSSDSENATDGLVSLVCYPNEDVSFRRPESCTVSALRPLKDWDQTSFNILAGEVSCETFVESAECNTSRGVIFERGFPVHEDVAAKWVADWVQVFALAFAMWWVLSYLICLYVTFRFWDENWQSSRDALFQGSLRHSIGLVTVVLLYFSAWGSPRRGGWFYGPYCPAAVEQEDSRLTFSFWCFVNSAILQVILAGGLSGFQSVVVARALYPEGIIIVSKAKVPMFLRAILDACPQCISLHGEEPDVGFMWENGRSDDLRLKTWKKDLCRRHHNCITIEIHIRPADSFSAGTIQSLGYSFYAKLQDMRPARDGSIQVYQAVVRSGCHVMASLVLERFLSNVLLLGFLHEIYFQHLAVSSACVRLEKRVRMLPQHEIEKLCHDCYTLSTSHLSRVKDFRIRASEGLKQAEERPQEKEGEAVFRAFSLRTAEKNHFLEGLASEGAWSKCAQASEREQSDEETPLQSGSGRMEPNRLGAPLGPRVPANSPAGSLQSSTLSVKDRWAKGQGTKEDWEGLMHKANVFVLRSYLALSERDPQIRHVEEATRAFIEAWDYGSLRDDPIVTQSMLVKVRSLFNSHLHKALACLDFQSVDDLRAAAEGIGGSGAQFGLLDPGIHRMMATHSQYLLRMAIAVGDRKALALALVESSRLMGELPEELQEPQEPQEPTAPAVAEEVPAAPTEKPVELKLDLHQEPCDPRADLDLLSESGELAYPSRSVGEGFTESGHWDRGLLDMKLDGDPWQHLKKGALSDATSFMQLLQMARSMYREKLFEDSQKLLLSDVARELLGDDDNFFLESWMQQQLAVMRTKQVGSLNSRAKRELEDPKFIRALQTLFDLTTRQVITRDRQGKLPTRLKVVKAKRSVNLDAYRAYFARRSEIEASMARRPKGARLDDCLTTGPSGCYISKEVRSLQGVWMDAHKAQWLVDGNQVFRVAAVAAQFLEPGKAAAIFASEDFYRLKPSHFVASEGDETVQFVLEVKKRVKDDEEAEESPQEKAPVKDKWHGWLSSSDRVTWYCERKAEHIHWVRQETVQGFWRVFGSFVLLLNPHGFREGSALLDARTRLGRSARRGSSWFDRELQVLQDEGELLAVKQAPSFVMHSVGELYPIWTTESANGLSIQSTAFKGFVDAEGTEMFLEPVSEAERPTLANFQPKRTLLSMRTTHVVQPFLSKTWAYRQLMSAELSAKELSTKANELWLFHGTRESAAECITENEFQVRMAGTNRGTMFGPGIYLADSVTKSDEYTDPDPTGLRTMILCRCTMGRAIKQEGGGRECMKACHAGGFHSVKGRRAYNEYIVYDENQVYPEYIIWYRRVYNIE